MAQQAFTDVTELRLQADAFIDASDDVIRRGREFIETAAEDTRDRMRREVPVSSGETRDSITVDYDADGLGASIGPTNTDDKGRPIGFFIEVGTSDTDPDPFVLRTSMWAERVVPDRLADLVRDVL